MKAKLIVLLLAALIGTGSSFAQETTGSLQGSLVDKDGNPIGYAHVIAKSPSLQGNRITVSDSKGRFKLLALPVGLYEIRMNLFLWGLFRMGRQKGN